MVMKLLPIVLSQGGVGKIFLPLSLSLSGSVAAGSMALPSGFIPYVEFIELTQQWKWIGKFILLFIVFYYNK